MADLTKTLDAVSKGLLYSLLASQCSVTSLQSQDYVLVFLQHRPSGMEWQLPWAVLPLSWSCNVVSVE